LVEDCGRLFFAYQHIEGSVEKYSGQSGQELTGSIGVPAGA
jgi:hypothetical protein